MCVLQKNLWTSVYVIIQTEYFTDLNVMCLKVTQTFCIRLHQSFPPPPLFPPSDRPPSFPSEIHIIGFNSSVGLTSVYSLIPNPVSAFTEIIIHQLCATSSSFHNTNKKILCIWYCIIMCIYIYHITTFFFNSQPKSENMSTCLIIHRHLAYLISQ